MTGIGIVGCGIISEFLLGGMKAAQVPLYAVCDVDESKARAAAAPFGARVYSDYDRLLADDAVGAIIISLPNFMHFDAAMKAVQARKHVFCEKPMTTCAADSRRLLDAARASDKIFQVGYMKRFNPAYDAVYRRLGSIGPLVHADITLVSGGTPQLSGKPKAPAAWHADVARAGGGFLVHSGSHLLDLMMHLLGRPERAWGKLRREVSGNEYDTAVLMQMPGGPLVHFHLTTTAARGFSYAGTGWDERVCIEGLNGRLWAGVADWRGVIPPYAWIHEADGLGPKSIAPQGVSQWAEEMRAFAAGIEQGKCLGSSVVDGYCVDYILGELKRLESGADVVRFTYDI